MGNFRDHQNVNFKPTSTLKGIKLVGINDSARLSILEGKYFIANLNMPYCGTIRLTEVSLQWLTDNTIK